MAHVYPGEGQTPAVAAGKCRLSGTPHALGRQLERGIEDSEIRSVIRAGTKNRVRERAGVSQRGGSYKWIAWNRTVTAVFYLSPCLILLKTVMYT
jgi:hypothetical protein